LGRAFSVAWGDGVYSKQLTDSAQCLLGSNRLSARTRKDEGHEGNNILGFQRQFCVTELTIKAWHKKACLPMMLRTYT
jgi:hypothetical protein